MADAHIRSFIAIPVPAGLGAALGTLVHRLRVLPGADRVRWVRAENLHVTLRFLGDIDPGRVSDLLARVGERVSELPAFELSLSGVELFPSRRRPTVVALGLEPREPLAELAQAVEAGVVAAGLPAEERSFRAHLTLGRIRERGFELDVTASDTALSDVLPVTRAVLYRSELRRSGAIHTPLGNIPLGKAAVGTEATRS